MRLTPAVMVASAVMVAGCGYHRSGSPGAPIQPDATTQPAAATSTNVPSTEKSMSLLNVGDTAPDFSLESSTGKTIKLSDFAGQRVVLYFYPKADTPGCTKEACGFRDAIADYKSNGIAVLGVSPDPIEAVNAFSEKYSLGFPLLADTDHKVCELYGVWQERSMYGKTHMGVARTTYIVGKDGKIAHVFPKVKPEGHDKEVLAWLNENPS